MRGSRLFPKPWSLQELANKLETALEDIALELAYLAEHGNIENGRLKIYRRVTEDDVRPSQKWDALKEELFGETPERKPGQMRVLHSRKDCLKALRAGEAHLMAIDEDSILLFGKPGFQEWKAENGPEFVSAEFESRKLELARRAIDQFNSAMLRRSQTVETQAAIHQMDPNIEKPATRPLKHSKTKPAGKNKRSDRTGREGLVLAALARLKTEFEGGKFPPSFWKADGTINRSAVARRLFELRGKLSLDQPGTGLRNVEDILKGLAAQGRLQELIPNLSQTSGKTSIPSARLKNGQTPLAVKISGAVTQPFTSVTPI